MHFYLLKHSVALSLIHQQWVRALYWPTCHCRPPECTCSQFVGIWNLSPTIFFAKPDLKDCSLQSFLFNLKFVTKSILLGKLLTKELFLQSTGVHKAISRKSEICHLLLFLSVLDSETILHNKFIGGCFVSGRNNPENRCKYIPIIVLLL